MSHIAYVRGERARMSLALDVLEYAAARLDTRSYVPLAVLVDAVAFIEASEQAAFEACQAAAAETELPCCVDRHTVARVPIEGMRQALRALDEGEAAAAIRFVRFARDYVRRRREDMRAHDNLFARVVSSRRCEPDAMADMPRDESAMQVYKRLLAAAAALDIHRSPALAGRPHREHSTAR